MLHRETARDSEANSDLPWGAVHCIDVAEVDNGCLVAKMLQRNVAQIKMYPLQQKVGCHEHIFISEIQNGGIVAHPFFCFGIFERKIPG